MKKLDMLRKLMRHIQMRAAGDSRQRRRLMKRAYRLYSEHQFAPIELIENCLLDPALGDEELKAYVSRERKNRFISRHVPKSYFCLTGDQSVSLAALRMAGLPTPELIAVFDLPQGHAPGGPFLSGEDDWTGYLEKALPDEFFIKPALSMLGRGTAAFRRDGADFVKEGGSERLTIGELYRWLRETADARTDMSNYDFYLNLTRPSRKLLIQKRLFIHPEIAAFTATRSLSCLRILTFVDRALNVRIIGTVMKVIANGGITDNYEKGRLGNIWVTVDGATGRPARVHGPVDAFGSCGLITHHPQSGKLFADFQIPFWEEAQDLARRAARVFLPHPMIGWDIAVTESGPILIEGNTQWSILPSPMAEPVPELFE